MPNITQDKQPSLTKIALTIPETVQASGLSRSTIYIAIREGALPARKCGARTVVLDADLRRFLRRLPAFVRKGLGADLKSAV
jgi:predicted DNA-binding transcriptional regulator AlpA